MADNILLGVTFFVSVFIIYISIKSLIRSHKRVEAIRKRCNK